jgi:hypothetical protein
MNRMFCFHSFRIIKTWAVIFICLFAYTACKTTKKLPHSPLVLKTVQDLTQLIGQNAFKYEWINAKLSANITTTDKDNSVTVNLRIRKDSAIWMSISPALGIEVARVLITKDSIKIMDRLNSKYVVNNYAYLNELLQVQVDFEMIQSLLIGNNFSYLDDKKFKSSLLDGELYVLSTLGKRRLKKTIIKDKKNNKELLSAYQDFRMVENQRFPFVSAFNIKSYKTVDIKIEYSKVTINKAQDFPFTIPEKYEKM